MADVMDQKSVKLGTSSALCAWRSVAMARTAFQRALALFKKVATIKEITNFTILIQVDDGTNSIQLLNDIEAPS